jgi:hypothetical protein
MYCKIKHKYGVELLWLFQSSPLGFVSRGDFQGIGGSEISTTEKQLIRK